MTDVPLPLFSLLAATVPGGAPELSPVTGLLLGLFLVFLNGFFVAAEFALVKVRGTQLDSLVSRGDRRAKLARHMVSHLDAYLSATQLGITLASIALGWVGEPAFSWLVRPLVELVPGASEALVHSVSLTAAFILVSVLHIVLGELAPKSLAIRKPEGTSLWVSMPLFGFYYLTYPAIWLLNHGANAFLKIFGIEPVSEGELAHDEEELRLLLASPDASRLSKHKRELLDNIFELSHRMARQIMVPRADVVYLSRDRGLEENLAAARESGHTRFPLCEGDLDHVVGLVHIKDLFRTGPVEDLTAVMREMAFVPETLELDRLLKRMRTEHAHMAAVLDEYGGVSGIVTLENVIEEIVGQIQDEFDMEPPRIVQKGPDVFQVSGALLVQELEEELGVEFSDRNEDTVGGVVLSELGGSPSVGDRVELGPLEIEVRDVDLNRVKSVRVWVRRGQEVEA